MQHARRRMLVLAGAGCAGVLAVGAVAALAGPQGQEPVSPAAAAPVGSDDDGGGQPTVDDPFVVQGRKVPICHRTGSARHPYVVTTVDIAAIAAGDPGGHHDHDRVGNGPVGDIIPPVSGYTAGKNWGGQWQPGTVPDPAACAAP